METDVVIIGAGPGGTVCALALKKHGINCVLVEKDDFPRYHIGESLTGGVGELLRDFGLDVEMSKALYPKKFGVKVYGSAENTFWVPVKKRMTDDTLEDANTWQVSRDKFDSMLLKQACEHGATLVKGNALKVLMSGDKANGVQIGTSDGNVIDVKSKYVVDASGMSSFLSQQGLTSKKERGHYSNQIAVYSQVSGAILDEGKDGGNTLLFHKKKKKNLLTSILLELVSKLVFQIL
jgi:flavin-dependent dehydrogenase